VLRKKNLENFSHYLWTKILKKQKKQQQQNSDCLETKDDLSINFFERVV